MKLFDILRPYQQQFFLDPARFKIANWSRRAGKDYTIAAIMCYTALQEGRDGLSICITTNMRTASELLRLSIKWATAICELSNGSLSFTNSSTQITFSTGSRIVCLPAGDGTPTRGWQINGALLISEAAYIRNLEDVIQGVAPAMATNPRSKLILASTPSGKNHYYYKLWCNAQEDPAWHASKVTVVDAIKQGMKADIDDLHKICPDPDAFATEFMCEFASEYTEFIDPQLLDFSAVPNATKHKYLGVDVGSKHDRTACATIAEANGEIFVEDIEILHKQEYTTQQAKICALNSANKYIAGFIDSNGIGSGLAEYVSKSTAARISGFTTTAANKPQLFENLRIRILERTIHFAPHLRTTIEDEISKISRIVDYSGKIRYEAERDENGHCDAISALLFALAAAKTHPVSVATPQAYAS